MEQSWGRDRPVPPACAPVRSRYAISMCSCGVLDPLVVVVVLFLCRFYHGALDLIVWGDFLNVGYTNEVLLVDYNLCPCQEVVMESNFQTSHQ